MRKKFAVNLIFLFVANLLVKPYWIFGIDRVVQNKVGPELYGTYFAVFNFSFLFSIILDFGINNFNNRAVSRNNKRVGEYLANLLLLKGALSVVYLVGTFIAATLSGLGEMAMKMLWVLAANQILLSVILYLRSNIAALQQFKTDSVVSILDRLLTIVFCSVLLFAAPFKESFNVLWFIYAQTAALFLTMLVAFVVLAGRATIKPVWWNNKFRRLILLKSAPFALLALLMGIYYRIDAVMIERMLPNGAHEAGVYAASFRLLDAVNMFGYLFATLLLPLFASMIRKRENLEPLVKFGAELMFAGSVTVAALCFFFNREIMQLLYPGSDAYWWLIFEWLMLGFIPMSSVYIYGTLLTAHGSMKALNLIAVGGVVVNVALNLFLIPTYGAFGAVIATLITQAVAALAHLMVAQNVFGLKATPKEIARMAGFTTICVAATYFFKTLPFHWAANMALAGTVCMALIPAMKIVPLHSLKTLLGQKFAS